MLPWKSLLTHRNFAIYLEVTKKKKKHAAAALVGHVTLADRFS